MNTRRNSIVILTVFALLAIFVVPTFAATTRTITLTETQVNDSYWVTNPSWRAVTERSVDFQAGQVVVNETISPRRGEPIAVSITYTPSVTNGCIIWSAAALMSNGDPVPEDLLEQINNHMSASWVRYWKEHRQPGRVTAIEVSEDAITVTLTSR